jgi:homoserine kinase
LPISFASPKGAEVPATSWCEAWAPASVGNVSVGFDLLGHAVEVAGDRVRAERTHRAGEVEVAGIRWLEGSLAPGASPPELPRQAARNTAGAAVLSLLKEAGADFGVRLHLAKGIPLGSGMGGSAASAVAALVAANELLAEPLSRQGLYRHALEGEAVASGAAHGDNVGPQLVGGLALALPDRVLRLPLPAPLHVALVHPHQVLETRRAREVLAEPFALGLVVTQTANLARLLLACERGDAGLLEGAILDVLVEPRRAPLIPGFGEAREAALAGGAVGAGISGGGPSLFAWFRSAEAAAGGASAMARALAGVGVEADAWSAPVEGPAARVEARG